MHKKLSRNAILTLIVAMGIAAGAAVLAWQLFPGIDPVHDARAAIMAACTETDDFDLTTTPTVRTSDGTTTSSSLTIRVSGDDYHITGTTDDGIPIEMVTLDGVTKTRDNNGPWRTWPRSYGDLTLYDGGDVCSDAASDTDARFLGRSTVDGVGVRRYSARSSRRDGNWDILVGDNNQLVQTIHTWTFDSQNFEVRSRYSGVGEPNVITDPEATTPRPTPTPTATPTPGPTATPTPTPEPTATPTPTPEPTATPTPTPAPTATPRPSP